MQNLSAHQQLRSVFQGGSMCSFELETTFDDNMGSYGNMFDIKTLGGEISIYAMDIYVDVKRSVNYEIYTKPNSFKDDDAKLSLKPWTLVKKGSVVGRGRKAGTLIQDFTIGNLTLASNEVRAFYVTLDSSDLRYRNITGEMPNAGVGDLYSANDDMELYVGVSVGGFPLQKDTAFFGKRVWSGRIHYEADRSCAPSLSPSQLVLATSSPSLPQSQSPSAELSVRPSILSTFVVSSPPSILLSLDPSAETSRPTVVTATPSHSMFCDCSEILETTLDGDTGAFGSMFTVTAKSEPVRITTLSLHTDFETSYITAMVYTKLGDFVGFENEPRAWRKISQSTFRGAGRGFLSRIPVEDFEPLYLFANDTVALYVTLKTADLRYSHTNISLGSAIASDDFIEIGSGVGVADYPFASEFFLYSPRAFNGAVHFSSKSDCQPTMNISYSFNVHHPNDVVGTDLNRLIENNVEMTARSLIVERPILASFATQHHVKVDSVKAMQSERSCRRTASRNLCTSIDATVNLKYSGKELREGELRFAWLNAYKDMLHGVNLMFHAEYSGDVPSEDALIISLKTREAATPMTTATQRSFEKTVMQHLKKQLVKVNVTILDVKVTGQIITTHNNFQSKRALQRENDDQVENRPSSTIDVSTSINGQYRPPPDIDYSSTIEDAMDAEPRDLERSLKRSDRYFEIVESLSSKKDETIDLQNDALAPSQDVSNSNTLVITFVSVILVFLVFVFGTCCWRRRQRKNRNAATIAIVHESDLLQERRLMAHAVLGPNIPVSSSIANPYSVPVTNKFFVAGHFQDRDINGYSSESNPALGDGSFLSIESRPF